MEEFWDGEGEEDSRLDGTFGLLVRHMQEGLDVRTGRCVSAIHHRGGAGVVRVDCAPAPPRGSAAEREARLFSGAYGRPDGDAPPPPPAAAAESFECEFAIVTVPLSVLQDGDIDFDPPLPGRTLRSIASLGWARHTVKLHMLFSAQFWSGQDIHGIIAANCGVPEMWFDRRPRRMGELVAAAAGPRGGENGRRACPADRDGEDDGEELLVVVGFAMDGFAE